MGLLIIKPPEAIMVNFFQYGQTKPVTPKSMKFNFTITFPTTLDALSNPAPTDLLENATLGLDHDQQHSNANDAIEALEAKVGINSSAVTTTHDYKLSAVTSSAKALTSGASTQSVTSLTLTTPVVNVGSDSTGDVYYRNSGGLLTRLAIGSTDQILAVSGGLPAWVSNPSASNASTTVKGVVEAATSAEVTAGTATGGTGAVLVVTPDVLLTATPALSAINFTNVTKVVQTAASISQINTSTAETTIYTTSIPGGTLGTTNGLIIRMYSNLFNTSGSTCTYTYRLKYGATTVQSIIESVTTGNSAIGPVEFRLLANASTSAQLSDAVILHSVTGIQVDSTGTAAEDSTATKNLVITMQLNQNSANARFDCKDYMVTKIS